MNCEMTLTVIIFILILVGILYAELDRKDKEIRRLEALNMKFKAELRSLK